MYCVQNYVILIILISIGSIASAQTEDPNFRITQRSLQEECSSEFNVNQTGADDTSGVDCNSQCRIDQWAKGCAAWRQSLDTNCKSVCNGTHELLPPKELFCTLGCHEALNRYYHQLKIKIGIPSAPVLVTDSLTATSLRLEWKGFDIKRIGSGISYFVQWRYEDLGETWQFCRNQSWREDDQILVYNLQSYTNYQFRIALMLRSFQYNTELIVSAPSVVILTKPAGVPISAPKIVRATAVDSHRVAVSWKAGLFSNGPLLSYILRLQGGSLVQIKEIPVAEAIDYYMFRNLEANKNYSVSLSMRNAEGDGPPAIIYISTSPEPVAKDIEQPLLILGSEHSIMKQGSDIFDEPSIVYETTSVIQGVAMHVASAQIFISDSAGFIYRKSVSGPSDSTIILNPSQVDLKPLSLSVDWLNLHLYIVGEIGNMTSWQIARCDLDGKDLIVAIDDFFTKPSHLEVDPYNGYLFWITRRGLYRLDLAEISIGISREVQPLLILEDSNLGAFIVDYTNFRILVSYHSENTVKSVSLDGKEVIDLRANTQQPKFKNVLSLAMISNLFYWTNGFEVLTEGYHSGQDKYFHNVFPRYIKSTEMYISVNVLMSANQPITVPVNPPTNVQAVFGSEKVKISWQAPYLLSEQGKGTWQNWFYELEVRDEYSGETIRQIGISELTQSIFNLKERSNYSIRAAAYTSAGKSPWSTEFKGQTLRDELQASILWSTGEGLLKSDVTGENLDILIHKTNLKVEENEHHIVDLSWYRDMLYLVGNNSALYQYNMTNHHKSTLNINSISSVAVDWISKKLYWTNPKQKIIMRSNMNGSHQDPVFIVDNVKELMIDSLEAYLYWTTGYTVEVSRLNGRERRYYHSDEIFSDKQVIGLTLDLENRFLYWIIRSYENISILYRAPTSEKLPIDQKIIPEKISVLEQDIQGPLCYFSQHLLWLQENKNAITGDLTGQNTATINGITLSGLYMTSILNPALHHFPESLNSETINVLPNAVDLNSIRIEGNWENFNISWDPVNNTNYGVVFYEVKFVDRINTNSVLKLTTEPSVPYNNNSRIVLPYTLIDVKIRAFTHWETARHTRRILRSPQNVPSQPLNPRAYVEFQNDPLGDTNNKKIVIIFRWDLPQFPNGLILGFTVKCWYVTSSAEILFCDSLNIPASKLEYTLSDLLPNMTYFFQVQAYTEVGAGPYTDSINISTESENPLPQLLIITTDMVRISDLDQQVNYSINRHSIQELTYLAADEKIFWFNEMQELVTSRVNGENTRKILSLNNPANSICVDWVSRNLFWTESSYKESNTTYIMKLDLSAWDSGVLKYKKIISRNSRIVYLDISPSRGKLFWVELSGKEDQGIVMYSDLSGGNVMPFFNHVNDCSCPFRPQIRPVFTIDNTNFQNPTIYWISLEGHLNEADIDGCLCNLVIGNEHQRGLPSPSSLTVDKKNVYWSNAESKKLYFVNKIHPDNEQVKQYHLVNARRIKTIGKSLQPYPDVECLTPLQRVYNVQEISRTKNSIRIRMPQPILHEVCEDYSLPSTLYTISLSECLENSECNANKEIKIQTYDTEFEVEELKPFTKYRFSLALSNYYSNTGSLNLTFSSGVILRTGIGIPTRPRNVTVKSLTPTTAAVYWLPPETFNADEVHYEIHWTAVKLPKGLKQTEIIKHSEKLKEGNLSANLHPLLPGQEYRVFIRAYPPNFSKNYNQSLDQVLKMYPEPNNLTGECFASALSIFWTHTVNLTLDYTLEFTIANFKKWQLANISKIDKDKVEYQVTGLQPKTSYKFRLKIKYPDYSDEFIWPTDDRFIFETLGDVPSAPGRPTITRLRKSVYQLNWEPARPHGSSIAFYRLEGKIVDDLNNSEKNFKTNKWKLYYNGTNSYWIITTELNHKYYFRVQAKNAYGFGAWSKLSAEIDLTYNNGDFSSQHTLGLILLLSTSVIISVMIFSFCYLICRSYRLRKENKKAALSPRVSEMELATLREIPRGNFVQSNALYGSLTVQNDPDDAMLPKIKKDQITLTKFLGSGAFGEVFQGTAKDLNEPGFTPVAIKTLRKGASSQEKTEFIQEAKLMSHFRHKHVLLLLGVCLETDSPLLVLELMEAGDLLSYLRTNRSIHHSNPNVLTLQDLLSICEDVARGCRYLEELHFVHRDLACRNCLVSANDREHRVVKIGDFGLARDIYKNDYYRKEGEGLLPVRWMAPESLVDGVFTSQSDVWAFGVLMWEITSLGQQPYPARTNQEVLHYVRTGGRLLKPLNCPNSLHHLMLRCWSSSENRPSFKACLEEIIKLRNTTGDSSLIQVLPSRYLSHRGDSRKSNITIQSAVQETTISASLAPKYLELLSNPDEWSIPPENLACENLAYEVPKFTSLDKQSSSDVNKTSNADSETLNRQDSENEETQNIEKWRKTTKKTLQKRLSVTSLNIPEKKKISLTNARKKSLSLDNQKLRNGSRNASVDNKYSFKFFDDLRKQCKEDKTTSTKCSETSLEENFNSSVESNVSLEPVTRPSSSLINSQNSGPIKIPTKVNPYNLASETNKTFSNSKKMPKTHPSLQKAKIPLAINNALLNLLQQTPGIENNERIITYTIINTDALRVNGS